MFNSTQGKNFNNYQGPYQDGSHHPKCPCSSLYAALDPLATGGVVKTLQTGGTEGHLSFPTGVSGGELPPIHHHHHPLRHPRHPHDPMNHRHPHPHLPKTGTLRRNASHRLKPNAAMAAASNNLMQTIGLNNSNFFDSRISVNISIKTGGGSGPSK